MLDDRTTYAPLVLIEYDDTPGRFCLMMSDVAMVRVNHVFEAHGRYGNGYGWADVALQAMRTRDPGLEARVELDAEAGGLYVQSTDLDALTALGQILRDAFHDPAVLGPLVAAAPYEWN